MKSFFQFGLLLFFCALLTVGRAQTNPTPVVTTSTVTGTISGCAGSPSASPDIAHFTVAGTSLTGDITITPPPGFDLSLTAIGGYSPSLTLKQIGGAVISTTIYVRSSASDPAGPIAGNIQITTPGATADIVPVMGTVNALPTVNPIPNQTVNAGASTTPVNFAGTADVYNWTNDTPSIGLPVSGTGNITRFTATNNGNSPVKATITATPQQVGLAYVPNSEDNNVFVFNTITNEVIISIPVGNHPSAVSVSPSQGKLYVSNQNSNSISVIDAASNTVTATIPVGNSPDLLIASPDGSRLYIGYSASSNISVLNTATNAISTISLSAGIPTYFAISPDGTKLYIADGGIQVVNTVTNAVTASINTGASAVALSPDGSTLYATISFSNSVAVINTTTNIVTATISNVNQPYGISVSPDNSTLYVTGEFPGSVYVISTSSYAIIATIPVGEGATAISMTQDGSTLYAVSYLSNNATVINTATNTVSATVRTGSVPFFVGNFITNGIGCTGAPASFTITVNSTTPSFTASTASGVISGCVGSPSVSPNIEEFIVSGNALTNDITATAPANFQISLMPGDGYSSILDIPQSDGIIDNVTVYVRSAASATGSISGNVLLTSPGLPNQDIAVAGVVNPLPSIAQVNNQTYNNGNATNPIAFSGTATNYTWTNSNPAIGLSASGSGNIPSFTATNTGTSPVTATITVTPGSAGFAYVADGAGKILVINTTSNLVVASVQAGQFPIGIAVTPDGSRVYVANSNSNDVTVIDAAANTVLTTIPIGSTGHPYFVAISPDGSRAYVANSASSSVSVINTITNTIISTIPVGTNPICLAVSPDGSKLYVVNQNDGTVSVINTANNALLTTIPIGANPYAEVISPDGSRLYVTTAGSTSQVFVINTKGNSVITSIPVDASAQGITITPDGSTVYVTNANSNTVSVISTANNSVIKTINVGNGPFGISASPDGSTVYVIDENSNSISIISTASNTVTGTITSFQGPIAIGNFISAGTGCGGTPITFTITVTTSKPSAITSSGTLSGLSTIYGTASSSESFSVSATNATAGILVTPPQGFEMSTDNQTFNATATAGAAGSIANVPVYIRLAATTVVGNYSGNIVLSIPGAPDVNVNMPLSTVGRAVLTVTAPDVTRAYGVQNPVFVPQYLGFVNGENQSVLITLPDLTTTATITSPVGKYPIHVSGGSALNYAINPVDGTLTIAPSESEILIPNAFTPNGDGINDLWDIKSLVDFPQCLVSVYTRYGSLVFQSRGYPKPWDGTVNGSPVPTGTYYYIINPNQSGFGLLSGFVAVLR